MCAGLPIVHISKSTTIKKDFSYFKKTPTNIFLVFVEIEFLFFPVFLDDSVFEKVNLNETY